MNTYESLLSQLADCECTLLRTIHHLGSAYFHQLREALPGYRTDELSSHVLELSDRELIVCRNGRWMTNWRGAGVVNWISQKNRAADILRPDEKMPEPRDGENGEEVHPTCPEYRELLFAQGQCWCGRARSEHFAEILKVAEDLIRRPCSSP